MRLEGLPPGIEEEWKISIVGDGWGAAVSTRPTSQAPVRGGAIFSPVGARLPVARALPLPPSALRKPQVVMGSRNGAKPAAEASVVLGPHSPT